MNKNHYYFMSCNYIIKCHSCITTLKETQNKLSAYYIKKCVRNVESFILLLLILFNTFMSHYYIDWIIIIDEIKKKYERRFN